jgi:hypothetical protein
MDQRVDVLGIELQGAVERIHGEAIDHAVRTGRLERTAAGVRIPRALRFVADDVIAWIAAASERIEKTQDV